MFSPLRLLYFFYSNTYPRMFRFQFISNTNSSSKIKTTCVPVYIITSIILWFRPEKIPYGHLHFTNKTCNGNNRLATVYAVFDLQRASAACRCKHVKISNNFFIFYFFIFVKFCKLRCWLLSSSNRYPLCNLNCNLFNLTNRIQFISRIHL
jgi:hypothetical protein